MVDKSNVISNLLQKVAFGLSGITSIRLVDLVGNKFTVIIVGHQMLAELQ